MDVLMVLVFHHTERHPQDSAWAKFLSIIHNMSCCELTVGTSNVILIQMIIDGIIDLHLRRQSDNQGYQGISGVPRHPQNAVSINQISCAMSAWGAGKRRQQRSWERRCGSPRRHGSACDILPMTSNDQGHPRSAIYCRSEYKVPLGWEHTLKTYPPWPIIQITDQVAAESHTLSGVGHDRFGAGLLGSKGKWNIVCDGWQMRKWIPTAVVWRVTA